MNENPTTEFVESLGIIFQNEGLPRIAGRVLGFLIVSDEPKRFTELVEELKVSKGSVSTNTRLLVDLGAIERTAKAGDRQDYFRLADEPYVELLERAAERTERARQTLERAAEKLQSGSQPTQNRLADLIVFFAEGSAASAAAAKRLRERRTRN